MADRAIDPEWVERTVSAPDSAEPDATYPDRIRAYRAIPERGGRILRVVHVIERGTCRIITVFFDRGRRRRT